MVALTNHQRNEIKIFLGMEVADCDGDIDWNNITHHYAQFRPVCARMRLSFAAGHDLNDDRAIIQEAFGDASFRRATAKAKAILDENKMWWSAFVQLKYQYLVKERQDFGLSPDLEGWKTFDQGGWIDYMLCPGVTGEMPTQMNNLPPLLTEDGEICLKPPNYTNDDVPAAPNTMRHISFGNCSPNSSICVLHWQLLAQYWDFYKRLTLCTPQSPFLHSMVQALERCIEYISEDFEAERIAFFHHFQWQWVPKSQCEKNAKLLK